MIIRFVITLILALVALLFIYKWALPAWREADKKEKEDKINKKLEDVEQIGKLHEKVKDVDPKEVKGKKQKISDIENL